jgi:hypothetical protein
LAIRKHVNRLAETSLFARGEPIDMYRKTLIMRRGGRVRQIEGLYRADSRNGSTGLGSSIIVLPGDGFSKIDEAGN